MRFPVTEQLLGEAAEFELRSACPHCFYYVAGEARCAHEWPNQDQSRWPLSRDHDDVAFCKEFELL